MKTFKRYKEKANEPPVPFIQPKLNIGKAGDKHEVEADAMADKVVTNTGSQGAIQKMEATEEEVQQKPLAASITPIVQKQSEAPEEENVQAKCADCEQEEKVQRMEEEEEAIQTKPEGKSKASPSIEASLRNSKGSGSGLSKLVKSDMESGFGADFSRVNIHTDENAVQMNKQLNAQAFTHGNDVYFNQGKYDPSSSDGKHLLAHELTHTIQQKGMVHKKIQMMSAAAALRIARSLSTTYPGWLGVLPDCPCTYATAMASPGVWVDKTTPLTSSYHPGADKDVRTKIGYPTIAGSSHGQQCTYDTKGKLITSGPGAGTPDVWTPNSVSNFFNHRTVDVNTYNALGSNVYVKYWPPNNGGGCRSNSGTVRGVPASAAAETKIVTIRDLLYGWTSAADLARIHAILGGVTLPSEMAAIRSNITPIIASTLSNLGDRIRLRIALGRI